MARAETFSAELEAKCREWAADETSPAGLLCKRMLAEIDAEREDRQKWEPALIAFRERALNAEAALAAERADHQEETALRERLATLLRGVANGLKGEPPPLTLWDWSNLPDLSQRHAALATAVQALRDSGYDGPFMGDAVAPLFAALHALERLTR